MKVLHIINSYSNYAGGAEKLVRAVHVELSAAGYDSAILGIEAQQDETEKGAVSLQLKSSYRISALLKICSYIRSHLGAEDLVHAHLFPAILYVSILKQLGLIRGPVVMTEHGTSNSRRGSIPGRLIDALVYRGYDRVFAISRGVESALLTWIPQLKGRTKVVLNGVRPLFAGPESRSETDRPVILSVGNLRAAKNYSTMLSALALLKAEDFEYWIAGTGEEEASLRELAASLGIADRVRFLGRVADLPSVYLQADIFLMASRWEGFGLAAVEAMNASLPVVVSDVPGLSEVVDCEPPCAIIVSPDSAASISEGLIALLRSRPLREKLGHSAFERAKSFTLDKMMGAYIGEYHALRNL